MCIRDSSPNPMTDREQLTDCKNKPTIILPEDFIKLHKYTDFLVNSTTKLEEEYRYLLVTIVYLKRLEWHP